MTKRATQFTTLNTIPNTIFFVVLIVGFGTILGLWGYEFFESNKHLPIIRTQEIPEVISVSGLGNDYIKVYTPTPESLISNPVSISGKADVFEANVRVRIKDENEQILADSYITAAGWMEKLYPFEKEIAYDLPTSQNGTIEIFEENVKDGNRIKTVVVPVIFEDYINISNWRTYKNEEYGFEVKYPLSWQFEEFMGRMAPSIEELTIINFIPTKERPAGEAPNGVKLFYPGVIIYKSSVEWELEINDFDLRLDGEKIDIEINGISGVKKEGLITEHLSPFGSEMIEAVLNKDSEPYIISAFSYDKGIFTQILSTFKFIKK